MHPRNSAEKGGNEHKLNRKSNGSTGLELHQNAETRQLLDNQNLYRRLKRTKPFELMWYFYGKLKLSTSWEVKAWTGNGLTWLTTPILRLQIKTDN